jgi:4-hydroxybenzoate polyprenyltransferase
MFARLRLYSRFIKVEHTLFSIPLLLSGAMLAGGDLPSWPLCALILAAGFGGRTVAFALNRLADRHLDALNPRTADRELPRGRMSVREAWAVAAFGLFVYLLAAWFIAPICLYLSPIPVAVFAIYPLMKRFTWLAHFGVGAADALAPLGGWVAVRGTLQGIEPGALLALFTFFWVSGFDVIYATMDENFDRQHRLHSIPAHFGTAKALKISAGLHAAAFLTLIVLFARHLSASPAALGLLVVVGALLYWEHAKANDVHLAFFKINAVLGFVVWAFVAAGVKT